MSFLEAGEIIFTEDRDDRALAILKGQIDYIRKLNRAETVDDFHDEVMQILSGLGFSDYALIYKTGMSAIDVPCSSLPEQLFRAYQREDYGRFDMMLDYIDCGKDDSILLSTIMDIIKSSPVMTCTFRKNEGILALYNSFGVSNAYVIPLRSDKKSSLDKAVLMVTAIGMDDAEFCHKVKRFGPSLKVIADAISFIKTRKFDHVRPEYEIKPKALRLLSTMVKYDFSLAEAADNLCISIDTANKHMAMAKQALGTGSQAYAVYLAIKKGLIQL